MNELDNQQISKKKFDYKWIVIGASFLMVMITLGFCSSPKSYFIGPVTEYLGVSRMLYSINDSCRHITTAVVSFFFGMLIKKFGARKLIAAGFVSLIGSSLCYALAENIWIIYLGGVLLGIGLCWTTTSMVGLIVNRWAKENKGTIMGAVLAANGIGGAIAMNIVSPIIETSATGYKNAYLVIAAVLAVAGVIVVTFIRETPKGKENTPVEISKKKSRGQSWVGLEYRDTKKQWYFYGALFCIFATGFFLTACNGVAVQHMKDVGLDPAFVTRIWSIHSLVLALFKFLTGFIYDKTGLRTTMLICTGTAMVVVVCLALVTPTPEGKVLAIIYSVFSGLALPLETVMLPIISSELFGERSFNQVLGIAGSANAIGYAVASPIMNKFWDIYGTYSYGMFICLGLLVGVIILMQIVITSAYSRKRMILSTYTEPAVAQIQE